MSRLTELINELCPNGVEYKSLGEIAEVLGGYPFRSSEYSASGVRIIRISDVQRGFVSDKDVKYIDPTTSVGWSDAALIQNDIVVSLTGDVGKVAMLHSEHLPAALNQRVACIRSFDDDVLQSYLYYVMSNDVFERELMTVSTGAAQKNLGMGMLRKYRIPVPPIEVQREIVRILDAYTAVHDELVSVLQDQIFDYDLQLKTLRNELLTFPDVAADQR